MPCVHALPNDVAAIVIIGIVVVVRIVVIVGVGSGKCAEYKCPPVMKSVVESAGADAVGSEGSAAKCAAT